MKIGLYLQDYTSETYESIMNDFDNAKNAHLDLFVFPETCEVTSDYDLYKCDVFADREHIFNEAMKLSYTLGSAVIAGFEDVNGYIFNVYANAFSQGDDTDFHIYIKHTMTSNSPLDFDDYENAIDDLFEPIILNSKKIGMTICYDCNHAAFSRVYGKKKIDIIINSTGGNVVYDKWYRYNRVRAIENGCITLCTMGYNDSKQINSYVFGFSPAGKLITPQSLYKIKTDEDRLDNIYIYDTDKIESGYGESLNLYQTESDNEKGDIEIDPYVFRNINKTYFSRKVKYIIIKNDDILKPEIVLKQLYENDSQDTKYAIINVWDNPIDITFYNCILDDILRVRSMENFCAVILSSPKMTKCFQCGINRTSQVIHKIDGRYTLDTRRMSGPNAIWKNKTGMRRSWRKGFEKLVGYLNG